MRCSVVMAGLASGLLFAALALADNRISPVCSRGAAPIGLPKTSPPDQKLIPADPQTAVAKEALNLVFGIETGEHDPYVAVTSNFDGEGLSLGLIQFNFGGDAQHTFLPIADEVYRRTMPTWGSQFAHAIHTKTPKEAIVIVTAMQDHVGGKWTVKPDAHNELRAFLGSSESRKAQDAAVSPVYARAYSRAAQWAAARGAAAATPREITSFLDNEVFSGGALGGMWFEQAKAFRDSFKDNGDMIAFVAAWLRSCPGNGPGKLYGADEGRRNADRWTAAVPAGTRLADDRALLFAFGFVRALTANGPPHQPAEAGIFKAQVVNRRGVFALGSGTANGVPWPGGVLDQ